MRTADAGRRLVSALVLLALFLSGVSTSAQVNVGRISGTVVDSTGAAVPGVTVTVSRRETGFTQTVATDGRGAYVFNALPTGEYTVSAELQGFKKVVKSGHDLVSDGRVTVNFSLEQGQFTDTIEVVAEIGESVNTISGEIARIVDSQQVQNLALNGRNYLELTTMIPGTPVIADDAIEAMTGLGINTTINGGRNNTTNLNVDGQYNMVMGSNNSQISNVGIDFIEEVTIKTSNFSAEYGRQSGANVNVTTKSGTNAFHGGVRAFRRDERWDANNYFLNARNLERTDLDYDNFGWSLGGAVKKNKLFFFGGQEWKQVRKSTDATRRTLPTTAELSGDFSGRRDAAGQPTIFLRDPLKTGPCNRDVRTGCFDNPQVVPASRITPDGRAIANLFRRMQQEARDFQDVPIANNAIYQRDNPFDNRQDILRLDYHASDTHRLYGRVILEHNEIGDPFGTFITSQLPTTPNLRKRPGRNIQVGHVWHVSPTVINELKAGAAWNSQRMFAEGDVWLRDTYNFQFPQIYLNGSRYEEATPRIAVNGFGTAESMTRSLISPTTDISFSNTVTMTKGAHSLKVGAMFVRDRVDQNGRTNHAGDVTFTHNANPNSTGAGLPANLAAAQASAYAFADALMGNFRTYNEAELDPVGFFRFSQVDGFVSDNWQVSRSLSIEAGLRYQWHQPIYTQANNITNFVASAFDPAQAVRVSSTNGQILPGGGNRYNGLVRAGDGVPEKELSRVPVATNPRVLNVPAGAPRGLYKTQSAIMPRFSFAFSPNGDNRMAFRGGVGVFYDRPEGNIIFTTLNSPPFNESISRENANLANPLAGTASALTPWGTIEALDPDFKVPKVTNWSLSVQRELPLGLFGEVAYVGSAGRNQTRRPDINAVPGDALRARAALPAAQQPNLNSLRPYAGYTAINMHLSDAVSDYHSLQLFLARRRGAFTYTAAYTYSKSEANASARGDSGVELGDDPFEGAKSNYGPTNNDRRHIFVATYNYEVPLFRNRSGLVKTLLHGWEIGGVTNYQSGPLRTPQANTVIGNNRRADYVGGPIAIADASPERWFNTDAFAAPPEDRKGTAEIGMIELPGLKRWNLTLRKRTAITRDVRLTLQVDAFNVFNHVNLKTLNVNVSNPGYGTLTEASPPRQMQIGMRLDF